MVRQQRVQIRWTRSRAYLIRQSCDFKLDSLGDRQPMEWSKQWTSMWHSQLLYSTTRASEFWTLNLAESINHYRHHHHYYYIDCDITMWLKLTVWLNRFQQLVDNMEPVVAATKRNSRLLVARMTWCRYGPVNYSGWLCSMWPPCGELENLEKYGKLVGMGSGYSVMLPTVVLSCQYFSRSCLVLFV